MKVRKLAVALALAGGLGSSVAQALGLGEIELQSYLNEPLDAEISLPQSRGVDPGDVFVNIAPESAYETVGLSRNQFLSKLRFQVITQSDGSLAVNVSSREPLREPYLNFLLELTWPNGRLMREYAVLVDPPVYAEDSGVEERVSAPAVTSSSTSRPSSSRSPESVRRQAQAEQSLTRGYQGNTFGPTGASDTLWTIASSVRPNDSVTTQQVMLAIQDLNPNAFIGGNINRLKRGEVLRVPTLDQIQSRTRAEATQVVRQQNDEFQSPQRTVDATDSQQAQSGSAQASAGGDELKLLVADNEGTESSDGGSAGGDGELPGGVDAGTAVAMEELESARRENDELNSRVNDLQDQVETLQRLLELKNSQLADMQQMAGESEEGSADESAPAEAVDTERDTEGSDSASATADEGAAGEPAEPEEASDSETANVDANATSEEGMPSESTEAATTEGESETAASVADQMSESAGPDSESGADGADMAEVDEADAGADAELTESGEAAVPAGSEQNQQSANEQPKPSAQPPVAEKGFPGNIIDAITGNLLYQVALGGGLILLLLLLLSLARRNANREKAFYEQLNSESGDESDSFELSLDDEDAEQGASDDALAEADSYIAYGRHDQAAQTLEAAISREPSRTDLRLKLLGVYAENQDRDSFEKQFSEIEALEDDQAIASANELRARLDEAEAMPSIDDLESQLRSDSFGGSQDEGAEDTVNAGAESDSQLSDELLADQYDAGKEEQVENEFGELDTDFADFDLNEPETEQASPRATEGETEETPDQNDNDGSIEFDLSGLSLESEEESAVAGQDSGTDDETDYSSLEMDLSDQDDGQADDTDWSDDLGLDLDGSLEEESGADGSVDKSSDQSSAAVQETGDSDTDSLDESFLDELDAELDKVAGEEDELGGEEMEESSLDDLELDVSEEDLALMEEFSDTGDSASGNENEAPALDEELNLEDTLGEGDVLGESVAASPEEEVAGTEELEDLGSLDELAEQDDQTSGDNADDKEVPVASEEIGGDVNKKGTVDIDESELGDDDDFDFLAGTDEAATKLDLARAYIEMGDSDGARDILEEVALEGNDDQKTEAQDLLKNLS